MMQIKTTNCIKNKQNSGKIVAALRLSRLWRARAPAQVLTALLCSDGSIAESASDIAKELGTSWSSTFARIQYFLNKHSHP